MALRAAQGIWQSAPGAAISTSAVVLPDGDVWAVLSERTAQGASTRVVKARLAAQASGFSGTGQSYLIGNGGDVDAAVTLPVTATVVEKVSLTAQLGPAAGSGAGALPESLALSWQSRYDTRTRLADLAGTWRATLGPGTIDWTVDAQGKIAGTRTTGCTYAGQLSERPEGKAVVNVQVQETCAGTLTQLSGVAVPQTDASRLTVVMTTADETQAVLFGLVR